MGMIRKFTAIVRLENTWWTSLCEDGEQRKGHTRRLLRSNRDACQLLDSMIDVVEEKIECTVRHTLEVDNVRLTMNRHSKCDDRLYSSSWLSATHNNNTMGAYIREQLAYFPCHVPMLVPNTIKKRNTLAMVRLVDVPQVNKKAALHKLAVEDCLMEFWLHPLRLSLSLGEEPTRHCHRHT